MLLVVSGFAFTMQYLFQIHQVNLAWFSYLSLILCDIFGFCIVFGILKLNGKDEEARELERLLEQEKRQLELLQNSMEIINIKAHDLKHYIDRVEVMKSENAESLDEIKEEIIQYESVCRTGNATLDIILMEKKLLCQKKDIHLSVIADGGLLSFLKPTEIASVLGNALDNAIEYEEKLNDPERRCIFLNISKKNGYVRIRVENYCEDFPQLVGGMPVTTKENRNFHGYGMKSIRYIVEKYHGNIRLTHENNFFVLIILIPVLET
jgi:sensor histidine kinase regulating citrate/malate metabolism